MDLLSATVRDVVSSLDPKRAVAARRKSTPAEHDAKVERIRDALKSADLGRAQNGATQSPLVLKKRAVSHQVPKRHDKRRAARKIDISDLDAILEIDPVGMTCTAEPGVTFIDLVHATMKYELVPTVVPELETITIGGAVSGCSLESMSYRLGGFHDSCLEYEVLTTNGDRIVARPDSPSEDERLVFQMMHNSFGTLGILTKLKFRLVPAKRFVHVKYVTYGSLHEYEAAIREHYAKQDVDFMDGIIHAPDKCVLSLGQFVDSAPYTHRYDWVTVYYRTTAERKEDYLQTIDYFFRYDRGVTNPTPRSFVARLLFGKLLDSDRLLRLAERLHKLLSSDRPNVTLDMFLPTSRFLEFMDWYQSTIGYFPLWCVPYKVMRRYEWIANDYLNGVSDDLFLDIAIYGLEQPRGRNYYKEIESELDRLRGIKTLISHNYYDEQTFWRIFNKPNYDRVKAITDSKNLLHGLYEKMCCPTTA